MFNIGSAISTQFMLWSLLILLMWVHDQVLRLTRHALCASRYTFQVVVSSNFVVDLSVLRANFTGSRRGPDFFEDLRLPIPCVCANPTMTIQPSRGVIQDYHWTCTLRSQKWPSYPRYRIQKNSRFKTRTGVRTACGACSQWSER